MAETYKTEVVVQAKVENNNTVSQLRSNIAGSNIEATKLVSSLKGLSALNFSSIIQGLTKTSALLKNLSYDKLVNEDALKKAKAIYKAYSESIEEEFAVLQGMMPSIMFFQSPDGSYSVLEDEGTANKEAVKKYKELSSTLGSLNKEVTKYEKALAKTEEKLKNTAGASLVSKFILIAAAVLVVVKALKKLYQISADTAEWAKDLKTSAASAFMTIEGYQKWSYILDYFNIATEKLRVAIRAMNTEANQSALKELGLFTGSNEQNFENAIKYIQSLGSEMEKTTMATKLFGRASDDLASIYLNTGEAIDLLVTKAKGLGLLYSESIINRAAQLADDINDLKAGWNALTRNLAITFMPYLEDILHKLLMFVAALNRVFEQYQITGESTASYLKEATDAAEELKRTLAGFDELELLNQEDSESSASESTLTIFSEDDYAHIKNVVDMLSKVTDKFRNVISFFKDIHTKLENSELVKEIKGLVKDVLGLFTEIITPVLPYIKDFFSGLIENTIAAIQIIRSFLTGDFSAFEKAVSRWLDSLPDTITNVFAAIGRIITSLVITVFTKIINFLQTDWKTALTRVFKIIVNAFVDIINAGITAVNPAVSFIGGLIGQKWTIPTIPRLANGGVAYNPMIAQIGEYAGASSNPEIVSPQSVMLETMAMANGEVVNALVQCTKQLLGGMEENRTEVTLDGNQLARSVSKANLQYKRQTGVSLI